MRATCALCLVLLLCGGAVRAEEAEIPIEVDRMHGITVSEAQLDWIRAWLRAHLHAGDLASVQVDAKNRIHPGTDFRAEARLAPRESGTYQVQRTIRFANRNWRTYLEPEDFVGDWAVEDRDVVRRIFDVDGERKVMTLDDSLSYDVAQAVLLVIARGGVDFGAEGEGRWRTTVRAVSRILREDDGTIHVSSGSALRGTWFAGQLKDERFVVTKRGMYIS